MSLFGADGCLEDLNGLKICMMKEEWAKNE